MAQSAEIDEVRIIPFRQQASKEIPTPTGVYALCDLDGVPLYVGQSQDGIRSRVRRHLTSARSDVIANRMLDVWEIAYVRAWPIKSKEEIGLAEAHLFHRYHRKSRLMNGSILPEPPKLTFKLDDPVIVQVMPTPEIESRRRIELRLPRQAKVFLDLLDHFLNVKDTVELHLALQAHFERLERHFHALRARGSEDERE